VRGEGCYLYDADGQKYLDGSGGAAVSCLGHGDADVIAAIQKQAQDMAFAHTGYLSSKPAEKLADLLVAHAPEGIARVYFGAGGSEAVEAAIKLARQYFVERGQPGRTRLIARRQSYHGNTIGALSAGGNVMRREIYTPLLTDVSHIAPCYAYALADEGEDATAYGLRAAQELEDEILRVGPDTVMAFMAETVVGATLGAVTAAAGYFTRIREICDRYGVLLILDEVMCGMGRTGHLFACEAEHVRPDILCIAKGLGGGYQPIGAMLCSQDIYDTIARGSGFFQHGHTYNAHPIACAAALAVLRAILDRDLLARVQTMGEKLGIALNARLGQHACVGDIRGRGLFVGIELVADRDTKRPFAREMAVAAKIKSSAFENGLICYPVNGLRDGYSGDGILLAPPFIITDSAIDELVEKLARSVEKFTGSLA